MIGTRTISILTVTAALAAVPTIVLAGEADPGAAVKSGEAFETAVLFVNNRAITRSYLTFMTAKRYADLDRIRDEAKKVGRWDWRDEAAWNAERQNTWRLAIQKVVMVEVLRASAENVRKMGFEIPERIVEDRWRQMLKDAGGPAELASKQGLSVAALKDLARDELFAEAYRQELRRKLATPTPQELRDYYQFNSAALRRPESVSARAVVIRRFLYDDDGRQLARQGAERRAREALEQLTAPGADFKKVVEKYSEDQASAVRGGMLGEEKIGFMIERGKYETELDKVLFSAKPGDPSVLVEGRNNYYVVQVQKHYAAGVPKFEEVEEEVYYRCFYERIARAEEQYFRDNYRKVLVRDGSGRQISAAEFFAEPGKQPAEVPAETK